MPVPLTSMMAMLFADSSPCRCVGGRGVEGGTVSVRVVSIAYYYW